MAEPKGVAQLKDAAAIVAGFSDECVGQKARLDALAGNLIALAGSRLAGNPMVLPLTAPIHRNALNLKEAGGKRFALGLQSLESQVSNLEKRAAAGIERELTAPPADRN